MAFTDNFASVSRIRHGADGLVGLHRETPNYRAWEYWQRKEFRKHFFPDWITVWDEWPPTTQLGADAVAQAISEIRDSRYQNEKFVIGGLPVPRHPAPWDGFVPPAPATMDDEPRRLSHT